MSSFGIFGSSGQIRRGSFGIEQPFVRVLIVEGIQGVVRGRLDSQKCKFRGVTVAIGSLQALKLKCRSKEATPLHASSPDIIPIFHFCYLLGYGEP